MDTRQEVKSLKKALRALTFMNQKGDSTVTEVAKAIGVPRPTSYRILETLASEGYVEKQPHSGLYRITSMVQRLSSGFQDEELLLEVAKPLVRGLGEEMGWPITIYTPRENHMIARINTDYDCPSALERFHVGYAGPILDATSGYCYLAHCSELECGERVQIALRNGNHVVSARGMDDMRYLAVNANQSHMTLFNNDNYDEICYLIKTVRAQGFCNIERKIYREGNVGVPLILDGRPIGAIVLRYIKSVMKNTNRIQDFYVPRLKRLAQDVITAYVKRREEIEAAVAPGRAKSAALKVARPKAATATEARNS